MVKNLLAIARGIRDRSLIRDIRDRLGRSPRVGPSNTLQYSCLENPRGHRRLGSNSPQGHKESDTTEVT